jgi:hypothetical protein
MRVSCISNYPLVYSVTFGDHLLQPNGHDFGHDFAVDSTA